MQECKADSSVCENEYRCAPELTSRNNYKHNHTQHMNFIFCIYFVFPVQLYSCTLREASFIVRNHVSS